MTARNRLAGTVVLTLLVGCAGSGQAQNTLTAAEKAAGWRLLFDGQTTTGWRGYMMDTMPSGWQVVDGVLSRVSPARDIVYQDKFKNFELMVDWKIAPDGNSGIFYRGIEDPDYKGAPNNNRIYTTGPEYQLLDDTKAADNKTRLTCAAAAYGLYPSPEGHLKPVGQWNKTRIIAKSAHVEHWLNDVKVVEYELWSPDWEAKVQAAKFKDWPKFGRAKRGHIGLQGDHEGSLAFRNIRIREL